MKNKISLALVMSFCLLQACSKNENGLEAGDCSSGPVLRMITNQVATIKINVEGCYIVEDSTYDSKLFPCAISDEYKVDNLRIVVTGEVRNRVANTFYPCCQYNLAISKIDKL